jgi:hypothetical protein
MSGIVLPCHENLETAFNDAPECGKEVHAYQPQPTETFVGYPVGTVNKKITPGQQHHGNCAVQTASQIIGLERGGLEAAKPYSEEQMEVLANCPKPSGYSRSTGTNPKQSLAIYQNAGLLTCTHRPTPENIRTALDAGLPVSTGHEVSTLWGEQQGGHRVTTVGYLHDAAGEPTAFLVSDTGRGCTYYVPADRYAQSITPGPIIIAVGHRTDCRDKATGQPFDPARCCLDAHAARRESLIDSAMTQPQSSIDPSEQTRAAKENAVLAYRKNIAQARIKKEQMRLAYAQADAANASAMTDDERAVAQVAKEKYRRAYWEQDKYEKEQRDGLFLTQDTITPMSSNDPAATGICAKCAKDVDCSEVRHKCPICERNRSHPIDHVREALYKWIEEL